MNWILAFGLPHGSDWIWILLIVLIVFGPKKLPELARGLGRSLGEFKKAKDEFERELNSVAADVQSAAHPSNQTLLPPPSKPADAAAPTATATPASNTVPQSKAS